MPVKIVTGDLFTYPAPAIAHGCNCLGAFNAGVAGLVRRHFPEVAAAYERLVNSRPAEERGFFLDTIQYVEIAEPATHTRYVINLFTQVDPGPFARIDAIRETVERLVSWAEDERVGEVAIPQIGAGIGGLGDRWPEVLEAIVEAVGDSLVTVTIVRLP